MTQLVKLGFLGFSVAIMILSYYLLQKIMSSPDESGNLRIKCREIRIYMTISVLVILIGLGFELLNPKVQLKFDVSPKDVDGLVAKVGGNKIDFNSNQEVQVQNRDEVSLDWVALDRKLRELNYRISNLEQASQGAKNEIRSIKEQQVKTELTKVENSSEAGL